MNKKNKIVLAFGGNYNNTLSNFKTALNLLSENNYQISKVSSIYITPAVDCESDAEDFYNFVLSGFWEKTPEELLILIQEIEVILGRPENHSSFESRPIDIDIILFNDIELESNNLVIPHPRAIERLFVMIPLAEIEPDWIFPKIRSSVQELLSNLKIDSPALYNKIVNTKQKLNLNSIA